MTFNRDAAETREGPGQRDMANARGGQDHNMALYQSAYDGGARTQDLVYRSQSGGAQTHDLLYCPQPGDDKFQPLPFRPDQDGSFDIPRCWPLPTEDGQFHFPEPKPTEKEQTKAETKLDNKINGLISDDDKQNLKDANHALLTGDAAALGGVYAKYKDDPEKLKAFVEEQNRELKDSKSDVGVDINDNGKIYVSRDHGKNAVEIDPSTGETSVRKVMHGYDGQVYVGDKVANSDPEKVLDRIGNHAVNEINEPNFRLPWNLQHQKLRGHFKHAFLMNMQDATSENPEMSFDGAMQTDGARSAGVAIPADVASAMSSDSVDSAMPADTAASTTENSATAVSMDSADSSDGAAITSNPQMVAV